MSFTLRVVSLISMALVFTVACGSSSEETTSKAKVTKEVQKIEKVAEEGKQVSKSQVDADKALKLEEDKFVEGKHYVKIQPAMQTDAAPGKVEVVELMWLGCPHCYSLEPTMLKYKKNHPDYVEFKQVPAMLNPSWAADGKTYYLAEMLDPTGEKEVVTQVFSAIHEQRRRIKANSVVRFFVQLGFSEEQITNIQNSMAYKAKLTRAEEIGKASQANSVPVIIINGKYRTSPYMAGNEEKLMKIVKMLAEKEKG